MEKVARTSVYFPDKDLFFSDIPKEVDDLWDEDKNTSKAFVTVEERIEKLKVTIYLDHSFYYEGVKFRTVLSLKTTKNVVKIPFHLFPTNCFMRDISQDLVIQVKQGKSKRRVSLSEEMETNLRELLRRGKPTNDFTCFQFAEWIHGLYEDDIWDEDKYERMDWDEQIALPGDIVLLSNDEEGSVHAMIYLEEGLFLGLNGVTGFFFTRLEWSMETYEATQVEILRTKTVP